MADVVAMIVISAGVAAIVSSVTLAWNGWRERLSRVSLQRMQLSHRGTLRDLDRRHEAHLQDLDRRQEVAMRDLDRKHESRMQVARILRSQSIPPAPRRSQASWRESVRQHAAQMLACEFFRFMSA